MFIESESNLRAVHEPKDNIVVNAPIDGRADFIVSGDHRLLNLKEFRGIKIILTGRKKFEVFS